MIICFRYRISKSLGCLEKMIKNPSFVGYNKKINVCYRGRYIVPKLAYFWLIFSAIIFYIQNSWLFQCFLQTFLWVLFWFCNPICLTNLQTDIASNSRPVWIDPYVYPISNQPQYIPSFKFNQNSWEPLKEKLNITIYCIKKSLNI